MQNESINNKKINKQSLISILIILLLIPATILFGVYFLGDQKYLFISLLIIIYIMIPFFIKFEDSRPKARELVLIAVMTSIAVAGRAAFFMIPQFKPVTAIVIITGISLGAEAGFITGAMTGFVSNFFFGQGPWTPWQMFCFGIIGFLAGVLYKRKILKSNTIHLCIFGGLATVLVYGGIINLGALMMMTPKFTFDALVAIYVSGFPFDLIHAFSTVVFLFLLAKPIREKLERVKIKYGM